MTRVEIVPSVLIWAQGRSGRTHDDFHAHFTGWDDWTSGRAMPTIHQVEQIARFAHLPFGILFLPEPPSLPLPIPDYRNGPRDGADVPSLDLLEVLQTSIRRQDWYRDFADRAGVQPAAFDQHTTDAPVGSTARKALRDLEYGVEDRRRLTREAARNHLRRAFERLGGLVIFSGMVANDNHRMLTRAEFRGFTLADEVAPLIFVNTHDDTLAGQIFTFFHEYGHVLCRRSGVSDEDPAEEPTDQLERWCNAFAAEALAPVADLDVEFHGESTARELDRLANRYLCSTLVVLLQLRRAGLVPSAGFDRLYADEARRVEQLARMQPSREGGNFYLNQPFRVGEKLSRSVLSDVRAGRTSFVEAYQVLGLRSADQLAKYAQSLGLA